jgi:hypothetical protein
MIRIQLLDGEWRGNRKGLDAFYIIDVQAAEFHDFAGLKVGRHLFVGGIGDLVSITD